MRKRSIKKQLWLNDKEDKILKEKSAKAGLSESEFIRSTIKGYRIKEQPNELVHKFLRQLYEPKSPEYYKQRQESLNIMEEFSFIAKHHINTTEDLKICELWFEKIKAIYSMVVKGKDLNKDDVVR